MKNTYYVIETDIDHECPEVKFVTNNKAKAWQKARQLKKVQIAKNALYRTRSNDKYFVTNSKDFLDTDVWFIKKLDKNTIIFQA